MHAHNQPGKTLIKMCAFVCRLTWCIYVFVSLSLSIFARRANVSYLAIFFKRVNEVSLK